MDAELIAWLRQVLEEDHVGSRADSGEAHVFDLEQLTGLARAGDAEAGMLCLLVAEAYDVALDQLAQYVLDPATGSLRLKPAPAATPTPPSTRSTPQPMKQQRKDHGTHP